MAQSIASWSGTVTPNTNMVEVFRQQELALHPNSFLLHTNMVIRKITIKAEALNLVIVENRAVLSPWEYGHGLFSDLLHASCSDFVLDGRGVRCLGCDILLCDLWVSRPSSKDGLDKCQLYVRIDFITISPQSRGDELLSQEGGNS